MYIKHPEVNTALSSADPSSYSSSATHTDTYTPGDGSDASTYMSTLIIICVCLIFLWLYSCIIWHMRLQTRKPDGSLRYLLEEGRGESYTEPRQRAVERNESHQSNEPNDERETVDGDTGGDADDGGDEWVFVSDDDDEENENEDGLDPVNQNEDENADEHADEHADENADEHADENADDARDADEASERNVAPPAEIQVSGRNGSLDGNELSPAQREDARIRNAELRRQYDTEALNHLADHDAHSSDYWRHKNTVLDEAEAERARERERLLDLRRWEGFPFSEEDFWYN